MPSRAQFTDPAGSSSPTARETARASRPCQCECAQGCGRLPGSGSRVTRSLGSRWGVLWAGRWLRGPGGGCGFQRAWFPGGFASPLLQDPQGLWLDEILHRRQLTLGSICLLAAVGQTCSGGSQALRWSSACTRLSFLLITLLHSLSWLLPTPDLGVGWHRQSSNPPGRRRECCEGREQPRDRAQRMCVGEGGLWEALRNRLCPSFLCPRTLIFSL